jgi:hypothetical protein
MSNLVFATRNLTPAHPDHPATSIFPAASKNISEIREAKKISDTFDFSYPEDNSHATE